MTMSFLLHDHFDSTETYSPAASDAIVTAAAHGHDDVHILSEKLAIPECGGSMRRQRLNEMLDRSLAQFGATLVSGRAGTGKTTMAAEYARKRKLAAWYSVESSDSDWNVFAHYLAAGILLGLGSTIDTAEMLPINADASSKNIAVLLLNLASEVESLSKDERPLIVLDGIHHLFDAEWFGGFFNVLLPSLSETADMLFLCRSKPPNPLWRLRSKQQLNVIDEKVIAFTPEETVALFRKAGYSKSEALCRHAETFGRIAKLLPLERRPPAA